MSARGWRCGLALVVFSGAGCGGARARSDALPALERMMASPAAREVARDAPEAYAEVVRAVQAAERSGKDAAATEAELTFAWALTRSRAAQARTRAAEAERRRAAAETEATGMEKQTAQLQGELARLLAARRAAERAHAAATAPATVSRPERTAAAADLRQEAALLVAAAQLLGATTESQRAVTERVTAAETAARGSDANAAFVAAGRAYTAAEGLLRAAREALPAAPRPTDGARLATELSGAGGFDPHRDARGVIAVFRGLFAGPQLAPTARTRVETLARVITAHGDARVRVEVFAGGAARAPAEARARAQAHALAAALEHAGVPHERLQAEGYYRAPGSGRADDRVEVVLVLPTDS